MLYIPLVTPDVGPQIGRDSAKWETAGVLNELWRRASDGTMTKLADFGHGSPLAADAAGIAYLGTANTIKYFDLSVDALLFRDYLRANSVAARR